MIMDERVAEIRACMYQYSRALYRSIKDLIDPYADTETQLEYRRAVLAATEDTVGRLGRDPRYFARPERALFADIRRYFPITAQAHVAWAVSQGIGAAVSYVEEPRSMTQIQRRPLALTKCPWLERTGSR